jgi:hypothetical protein
MDASNGRIGASSPLPTLNSPIKASLSIMEQATRPPKLLPAFEPFSSSPPAARLSKKRPHEEVNPIIHYPTPVPTSSTGILPSSPRQARPTLQRTTSTMSERAPLCDVPTVQIPSNGQPVTLGRASTASSFKLPYNRLISRVHVSVTYHAPSPDYALGRVEIQCKGWNGCRVLYKGRDEELAKDEIVNLKDPSAEIMLDILDTRVILAWPNQVKGLFGRASSWLNTSPNRRSLNSTDPFCSSPPRLATSPPSSPTKAMLPSPVKEQVWAANLVQVYEDPSSDDVRASPSDQLKALDLPPLPPPHAPEYCENENEENEPMVHTFGPFGSNLLKRLHSITATSPEPSPPRKRAKLDADGDVSQISSPLSSLASQSPSKPSRSIPASIPISVHAPVIKHANESPIKNHVINQLAFSRVHSTPISTIFKALPANLKHDNNKESGLELTPAMLRTILEATPCVGEIAREGKDAAGKPLENEFYYNPEQDDNMMRKETVMNGLGSTSIRAVRKNHKVSIHLDLFETVKTNKDSNISGRNLEIKRVLFLSSSRLDATLTLLYHGPSLGHCFFSAWC